MWLFLNIWLTVNNISVYVTALPERAPENMYRYCMHNIALFSYSNRQFSATMFLNLIQSRQNIKQKDSKNYTYNPNMRMWPPIICATINRRDYCESRKLVSEAWRDSLCRFLSSVHPRFTHTCFFFSFKYQKFAPPTIFFQTIHSTSGRSNIRYDFFQHEKTRKTGSIE